MKIRKEIREWGIILGIFGFLYFTGLWTDVSAFAQRMVLATGVANAGTGNDTDKKDKAEYDFKLLATDGSTLDFETMRGKVVFINFWATWCGPCRAEMPSIQGLYDKVSDDENIEFVMITLDKEFGTAKRFVQNKNFTFPIYAPDYDNLIPKIYESRDIPTTFIVSPEGYIDYKKVGIANYNTEKFRKYLLKMSSK